MALLQFWFDFASTYSYPAAMRIEPLARARRVPVGWKPFLLGPIFAEQGWTDSPFNLHPAKGRYMWRDLARTCERIGLELKAPVRFPQRSVLAARVACLAEGEPWCGEYVRAVFRANFAEQRDISEEAVIGECLGRAGADPALVARAQFAENRGRLRGNTEAAQRLGIFGAPSFTVGDELFWGNDRLEEALEWAAR
jgi:2-hydroxychromene-2-carboxylate isomerase